MNEKILSKMMVGKNSLDFQGMEIIEGLNIAIKKISNSLVLTEYKGEILMPHIKCCIKNESLTDENCVEFVKSVYPEGTVVPLLYWQSFGQDGEPFHTFCSIGAMCVPAVKQKDDTNKSYR